MCTSKPVTSSSPPRAVLVMPTPKGKEGAAHESRVGLPLNSLLLNDFRAAHPYKSSRGARKWPGNSAHGQNKGYPREELTP